MSEGFEAVDRYGGVYPPVDTVCKGQCEGLGHYPQRVDDPEATAYERAAIAEAIREGQSPEGGYLFIRCGECGGSGERKAEPAEQ